jgi:hypothetical protein
VLDGDPHLELDEGLEPGERRGAKRVVVEVAERLEADRAFPADVVVASLGGGSEEQARVVAVEEENPAARVPEVTGRKGGQEGALARARRADDDRVGEVARMEVEPERRVAVRASDENGGGSGRKELAGVPRQTRPERGEREEGCGGEEVEEGSSEIRGDLAGQRAVVSGGGVVGLDTAGESEVREELGEGLGILEGFGAGGAGDEDD